VLSIVPTSTLKGYYALRLHSRRSSHLLIYCDRLLYFDVMFVYNKVFEKFGKINVLKYRPTLWGRPMAV